MLLTIKTRQKYLKELGFYSGAIDGIAGAKTKAAYKALQQKYFVRSVDIDGKYGKNTDILLRNAYNVAKHTEHFSVDEFKCKCGNEYCTGYPAILDVELLKNLQKIRDKYGSTTILSGLRCNKHNAAVGGVSSSRHKTGKAADIQCSKSKTKEGRAEIMNYWKTLPHNRYTYADTAAMGNSVHVDVR